jgi:hypothetical protein
VVVSGFGDFRVVVLVWRWCSGRELCDGMCADGVSWMAYAVSCEVISAFAILRARSSSTRSSGLGPLSRSRRSFSGDDCSSKTSSSPSTSSVDLKTFPPFERCVRRWPQLGWPGSLRRSLEVARLCGSSCEPTEAKCMPEVILSSATSGLSGRGE